MLLFLAMLLFSGAVVTKIASFFILRRRYRGRMVVVPNCETDIYSRLWCVYEIFIATRLGIPVEVAHTLAPAGNCGAESAGCGSEADTRRIREEIEAAEFRYAEIDRTVSRTIARWDVIRVAIVYGYPILLFSWPLVGLRHGDDASMRFLSTATTFIITFALCAAQHWMLKRANGKPSILDISLVAGGCIGVGVLVVFVPYLRMNGVGFWMVLDGLFGIVVTALCICLPRRFHTCNVLWVIALLSVCFYIVLLLFEDSSGSCQFWNCYPAAVASLVMIGSVLAPLYVLWSASERWGVRVRYDRRLCRRKGGTAEAEGQAPGAQIAAEAEGQAPIDAPSEPAETV